MTRLTCILVLSLLVTACAAPDQAGVSNPELFRQVAMKSHIDSARPYVEVVSCFRDRAELLPFSDFLSDASGQRMTYQLRGFGYTFEEIEFAATPKGSRATIFIAPNLNAKWHEDFAKNRAGPLKACAAGRA